ncbi:uncharacterized protein [Amphiura filiformis]|uniref:uncharacterized protein n=1 Tax=Amphiura filiformis TaxID=82378 RepID=UPI003B22526A
MAAPCENFDRVNEFIEEVCQNVEDNCQLSHLICLDSHKLLQPWPSKVTNDDTIELNLDSNNREVVTDSQRANDREGNKTDDAVLSAEEAKALAEVDDILSKAQEARKLQAKLTRTTAKKARTHTSQSTKQSKPQHYEAEEPSSNSPPTLSSDCNHTEIDSDPVVITESKLQSLLSHTTTKPSTSAFRNQAAPKIRKNLSGKGASKTSASSRGVVKVPRPTSAAKMQYKTSSSEIGKHNVNRKPPSGSTNRTLQRHKDQTSSEKLKPSGNRSQSVERRPFDAKKLTRSQSEERRPKVKSSEREVKSAESKLRQQDVQLKRPCRNDLDNAIVGMVEGTDRLRIGDSGGRRKQDEQLVGSSPSFLLRKDGSTLTVPAKLRKLHSSAEKLREKLSSTSSLEVKSNSVENHFKTRLEAKFSHEEAVSLRDLEVRLQQLHSECSQLCFVARELQKLATNITGICTWQEIYRTKAMLHTITIRYNELQQEIQQLRKVEKSLLSQSKQKAPQRSSSHKRNLSLPLPTSSWIPSHTEKKNYRHMISPTSDGAEGASSGCSSILPSSTGSASSVMQYNRAKDLKRLTALQYQAQFVMWQMDLEKLIADDILPLLKDMDPTDAEFIPLYRTIYGLLCQSAEAYPALVRDNIGDSDEENGDHG